MATLALSDFVSIVSFLDPAGPKKQTTGAVKNVSARSALVTIGMDTLGRVLVLQAWADRVSTLPLIDKLYEAYIDWNPRIIGIEANAMQILFAECASYIASQHHGVHLPVVPVYQPTNQEKTYRIRTALQPLLGQGRLFLTETFVELIAEMRVHPRSQTVDLLDALASAVALLPKRPERALRSTEIDDLAEFLRNSDVPPSEITHRIEEAKRTSYVLTRPE